MAFVQEHSNINFHYRTSSVKINDKIFQKILETLLLAHFSNFGGKINFLENLARHTKLKWVLSTMPKFRKN